MTVAFCMSFLFRSFIHIYLDIFVEAHFDPTTSIMPVAVNPYLRSHGVYHARNNPTTTTMGLQSQHQWTDRERNRAINKAKEAKRNKHNQTMINGVAAFESLRHCVVCKARGKGQRPMKRAHHAQCRKNRKTGGLVGEAAKYAQAAADLMRKMEAPVQPHERLNIRPTFKDGSSSLGRETQ